MSSALHGFTWKGADISTKGIIGGGLAAGLNVLINPIESLKKKSEKNESAFEKTWNRMKIRFKLLTPMITMTAIFVLLLEYFQNWVNNEHERIETTLGAFAKEFTINPIQATALVVIMFLFFIGIDATSTAVHSLFAEMFKVPFPEWVLGVNSVMTMLELMSLNSWESPTMTIINSYVQHGLNKSVDMHLNYRK